MQNSLHSLKVLLLSTLLFNGILCSAQNPTYSCIAKNDTLLSPTLFQFDIYIYRTGSEDFYLNNYQFSFKIQNTTGILNGGTITGSVLSGSSELPSAFLPGGVNILTSGSDRFIRVNGCPSTLNGTIVPVTGLRIGTIRLTNTNSFGQSNMNIIWSNGAPATSTVKAMVSGASTVIFNFSYHSVNFSEPVLNAPVSKFTLTGGGNYCSGGGGVSVGTENSETGILYKLIKNGSASGSYLPGTGSAISFGLQTAGTYRCYAYRRATYLSDTLTGIVSINEINIPAPPVITQSGNVLNSTAPSGNQWFNSMGLIPGATSDSYTPTATGDYYCTVTNSNSCTSDKSNTINVIISSLPGIDEMDRIIIYPNPTTDNFTVHSPQKSSIQIIDVRGKIIRTLTATANRSEIDISDLPRGLYVIKIDTEKGFVIRKVIKQ